MTNNDEQALLWREIVEICVNLPPEGCQRVLALIDACADLPPETADPLVQALAFALRDGIGVPGDETVFRFKAECHRIGIEPPSYVLREVGGL